MKNKNYIKIVPENVDNNYIINRYYIVKDGESFRVEGNYLKTLKRVLKDYQYIVKADNSKVFTQFDEIMFSFMELQNLQKLKKVKQDKVNRKKSMTIKVAALGLSIVLLTSLSVACGGKKRNNNSKNEDSYVVSTEIENSTTEFVEDSVTESIEEVTTVSESVSYESTTEDVNDIKETSETFNDKEEKIIVFQYESDETIDEENIEKALRYKDLFIKYGERYGVPWQLLCAMAAQENGGIHDADYSEPAIGIMQIERDALINHTFNLYNYETNSTENFTITNSNDQLEDLEYNIKAGCAELSDCFRVTYNVAVKEGKLEVADAIAYATQRYNMGGGNMAKTLNCGGYWMDNRDYISKGDRRYFEKVFDGVQQLGCDVLCIKYYDEEAKEVREVKTKIVNTYNKNKSK